ncbi:uncharacterized protein DS421_8g232660 [Arachis hypogaea]|nr:uncharacterized protein DS421_8g232660 [Arachis hypogaea]
MSEEKKTIVRNLEFGGLMYIPPLKMHHQILRELASSFKLGESKLETGYDSFKIRQKTIGDALGINASRNSLKIIGDLFSQKVNYKDLSENDKQIFRRFHDGIPITNDNKQNLTCASGPNFQDGHNNRAELGRTCFEFHRQRYNRLQDKKREERPPEPWITNWTKEQLVERMRGEMKDHTGVLKMGEAKEKMKEIKKKEKKKKAKKQKKKERMESKKRKNIEEDSDSEYESTESESTDESEESSPLEKQKTKKKTQRTPKKTQSKKKKVILQDSSLEQTQSYHGSEIGTQELDEFLRENIEKSAAHGLSLFEESASEPAEENVMVMREETPSEVLAIVSIQVCLPLSQTTTTPETENEPTPLLQIEGTTKSNPVPEDAEALMMMARTASYVPKADSLSSFSLGLTDSSQEEATTQEGAST